MYVHVYLLLSCNPNNIINSPPPHTTNTHMYTHADILTHSHTYTYKHICNTYIIMCTYINLHALHAITIKILSTINNTYSLAEEL